jgi:D-alanyl-D-alanine carboxypeptidase
MKKNIQTKKSLFYKYKILCSLVLVFCNIAGCSFVWNAMSVYVFAYQDGQDSVEEEDENYIMVSAEEILSANSAATSYEQEAQADELSKDDWRLILINKQHSIPDDYTFTFGSISTMKGTMKCDERIISDLLDMLQGAKDDGINLQICSPYRDMDRQVYLFDKKIKTYMKQGMSYMDAYALTAQAVTVPGASEHQIGLALDIVSDRYAYLNEGFGETDAGKWLAEHSCEYGFILRYPQGKEYITGIEYEPWHFRYVGVQAATIMTSEDLTLEEFVASLEEWR